MLALTGGYIASSPEPLVSALYVLADPVAKGGLVKRSFGQRQHRLDRIDLRRLQSPTVYGQKETDG
jgi:hypothetical protein